MRALILFSLAAVGSAQSPLAPPLAGIVRDPLGQVRRIFGVSGNLIAGPVERSGVVNVEFTGRAGMMKTDAELILLDREARPVRVIPAPPGLATFEFDIAGVPRRCQFENGEAWESPHAGPADPARAVLVDGEIRLRLPDGAWRSIPLAAPVSVLSRMGATWLAAPPLAIELTPQGPRVHRLPREVKQ